MNIYDKTKWHIEAGEDESEVIQKFTIILNHLNDNNMLNENGIEVFQLGINDETSIFDEMLTKSGLEFMDKYYTRLSVLTVPNLQECLKNT